MTAAGWDGAERRAPRTRREVLWRWLDSPRATSLLVSTSTAILLLTIGLMSISSNNRAQRGIDQVNDLGKCILANVDDHRANSYEHFVEAGKSHGETFMPKATPPVGVTADYLREACAEFTDER